MNKIEKIKVGISIGDINGIGLEIILKTFQDKRMLDFCTPILFGSTKLISAYKKEVDVPVQFNGVAHLDKVVHGRINILNIWKEDVDLNLGQQTQSGGAYAYKSLEAAVSSLNNGGIDVLVTAPICKDTIQSEDFAFPGHTEYLESELEGDSLMILMTEQLKIGLVTGHIPIAEVSEAIQADVIRDKVNIMHATLKQDFGLIKPKIGLLALNPHCGDNGVIGQEDDAIVKPVVDELREEGKMVFGPYAADSFFGSEMYKKFDAVLAMYHDQGLGPFKTLSFGEGVNYTAGLSKIRTSPDHGTAFEMAGKGKASYSSFKEAVFTALKLFKQREEYKRLTKNVLKVKK